MLQNSGRNVLLSGKMCIQLDLCCQISLFMYEELSLTFCSVDFIGFMTYTHIPSGSLDQSSVG